MSKNWWGILIALLLLNLIWSMASFINVTSIRKRNKASAESTLPYTQARICTVSIVLADPTTANHSLSRNAAREVINRICLAHSDGFTLTESMRFSHTENGTPNETAVLEYSFRDLAEERLVRIMDAIDAVVDYNELTLATHDTQIVKHGILSEE